MTEEEKLPKAISEGVMYLYGMKIRVINLDDGRRIVDQDSMNDILKVLMAEEPSETVKQ